MKPVLFLFVLSLFFLAITQPVYAQEEIRQITALTNGMWFNGQSFEPKTMYSVDGYFTINEPKEIDNTIDLTGMFILPPFAEAHNHNLNGGNQRNRENIRRYLTDGVFYVKLQSNFYVTDEEIKDLQLNTPYSIDVSMAQGASLSTTGGHPYQLAEDVWFRFGFAEGPVEALNGQRFFTIDSEEDLSDKWYQILDQKPDFIKTTLWNTDEFEKRKNNKEYYGQFGLRADLFQKIVDKAHEYNLRVSTHVNSAYDFHIAVTAGADEINHLPITGLTPIELSDIQLAASRGIVIVTTCNLVNSLRPNVLPDDHKEIVLKAQIENLQLLRDNGVILAIGSDMVNDSSVSEVEYLKSLNIFTNLELIKMWTEATPKAIFPERKIGFLDEGYEASFISLTGNPIEDFSYTRNIVIRFKQGRQLKDY